MIPRQNNVMTVQSLYEHFNKTVSDDYCCSAVFFRSSRFVVFLFFLCQFSSRTTVLIYIKEARFTTRTCPMAHPQTMLLLTLAL